MKKVEYDQDGYPVNDREDGVLGLEKFTEEDFAFLEELNELTREFQ